MGAPRLFTETVDFLPQQITNGYAAYRKKAAKAALLHEACKAMESGQSYVLNFHEQEAEALAPMGLPMKVVSWIISLQLVPVPDGAYSIQGRQVSPIRVQQ